MPLKSVAISVALLLASVAAKAECQRAIPVGIVRSAALAPERRTVGELLGARLTSINSSPQATDRGGAWGAGIGALLGGATGLLLGLNQCDAAGSHRGCITTGAAGGVFIGAAIGYGVGWIIGNSRD
ncbi:MAG: hypothetical protein ABI338_02025 [Gemmatimonadaceae bacterium]